MGEALGLQEQKSSARQNFMRRENDILMDGKPNSAHGEPTCVGEDHSFMNHKPGGSDTLPGWGTMKNVLGS